MKQASVRAHEIDAELLLSAGIQNVTFKEKHGNIESKEEEIVPEEMLLQISHLLSIKQAGLRNTNQF